MRIGINIDNCISNFYNTLFKKYSKLDKELEITQIINENNEKLNPLEKASYYIEKLKNDRHEIYIITQKNNKEYKNNIELIKNWLHRYNILYDKLIFTNTYNSHTIINICIENNIDLMIEDNTKISLNSINNEIKVFTINAIYDQKQKILNRVSKWEDLYIKISKLNLKKDKINLSTSSKILILDQSIGKIINIFLDTFLAAYFYKISQQSILYLSIYNIIGWIFATIVAFLIANIVKNKNKIKLYRFGTLIKSIYIFIIMILGKSIVDYVYLIGIIYGISTATTGFPYNMIESESVTNKERSKYVGFASVATEIISLIMPILLGAYITFESYQVAASLIFIFSVFKLILSFKIKNKNIQSSKVNLKEFYNIFHKDSILKKIYTIEFFKGLNRYGVMSLVVSLLIIYQSNNELELGSWTSLFSLFTIIAMYLFAKFYKNCIKKTLLISSSMVILISSIAVFYKINLVTIIIYNIAYYIFMNIILKITDVNLFNYSNKKPFKTELNTEYFIFRELFLNIGRILGYTALLFLVGFTNNLSNLKIIFGLIICSIIATIYLSLKVDIESKVDKEM